MAEPYDVGDVLPVDSVPAGTNLMVGGPPLTGKVDLALSLVEDGCLCDEGALVVSTRDSADRLLSRSTPLNAAVSEGRAGVVDCVTRERGEDVRDSQWVRYASSPGDVTDIGIRTAGVFSALAERDVERVRSGLVSIPTMLMYAEPRRVFRFLHVYTGRIQSGGMFGVAVTELGDKEAFKKFAPLFDGMVQTRTNEADERELRVVGVESSPTEWVSY
ncbi:RAD55 family ATPase [Halarchaeum sp. P4]|uniref:RAD55 family ATPase n=1 Tax=Halarchaeum sp. P4 TaxID=3421639 RepID=UPI003EB7FC0A